MRFRTLEIRWHDSKPISTCDFQPVSFKKARPPVGQEQNYAGQSYRLASGGEDNHIRIWMVHPNILPANLVESTSAPNGPRPPRVEYLATLSRHSAAVNVVRWSPNGDVIASAGDDGMIIIWAPSSSPQPSTYGSDLSPEDLLHEKEYWKPRITFRCSQMQVYDLAWSPTGEYVIAGSTDNTARVFSVLDGKCVWEIAEHSHYVQGVAWDPLNEYVATQSSDRSMHIYRISMKNGTFEAHAIGKNTRMPHRHSRTPSAHGHASSSRPRLFHRESTSDIESVIADDLPSASGHTNETTPLTPAMSSVSGMSSAMFPPPIEASSRRSSFSGSNAPGSPSTFSRYGRSPSPMPPLPAIRSLPANSWSSVKLYGDESFTNFFRRLTFSPDGGLLLTPAGQFEDPSNIGVSSKSSRDDTPARGRKGRPSMSFDGSSSAGMSSSGSSSISSVFVYSRANFARPPIAQLPGHKKASVAVRFSPILYELRPNVEGGRDPETKTAALEKGVDGAMDVDIVGPTSTHTIFPETHLGGLLATPQKTPQVLPTTVAAPVPKLAISTNSSGSGNGGSNASKPSPALSPMDMRPPTPAASKPPTPAPSSTPHHRSHDHSHHSQSPQTGSIFALPYRMLYSVITKDTVCIYDTQQAGPVCLLTKLHYDEFTDMTWSPDGQTLMLSSRDGYCTIVIFDEILASHHTQQHALQMQSIAHHHSVPLLAPSTSTSSTTPHHNHSHSHSFSNASANVTPAATPASANIGLPPFSVTPQVPKKRAEPPLTPAASVDGSDSASYFSAPSALAPGPSAAAASASTGGATDGEGDNSAKAEEQQEPPKKKRRVALTRVGDLPQ